ncbi:MAG: penicillin-binding protein 1C [Nitrospiraceae bacterium]|nr:penicillin-binding protein 1C [Nitrospiraceae bacterium]
MIAAILVSVLVSSSSVFALPSFQEVKAGYKRSDSLLLDRHGQVIHELRTDPGARRLEWAELDQISPALIKAVIHSEDQRFYSHSGVDWRATAAAAIKGLFGGSRGGASTITMQLASMLDRDLQPKGHPGDHTKRSGRTISQKWKQMSAATEIEKTWNKGEVLDAYLNLVFFRGELQGISAASRGLFDKEPHGLDETESLLLAALIRSPNADKSAVSKRACLLAQSMKASVGCEGIEELAGKVLSGGYEVRQQAALAPHVARKLLGNGVEAVSTTLDRDLQAFSSEVLQRHIGAVRSRNVTDGAVLIADNRTGEILAYVGSSGAGSPSRFVDGVVAKRQAGSTLKPFLYGLAFEEKILTPASMLSDSPLDIPTGGGIYKPGDYESDYKGMVSARTALASSLNIPAVRVIGLAGVDSFVRRLGELGFRDLEPEDFYGPSAALGSVDVSLFDLVNAYRTLANGGLRSDLRLTPGDSGKKPQRVFPEPVAYLVSDILSDRQARSVTFGLENALATRFWSAVKTGTSKDMRDNWCVGYSDRYTVGVWVGNFSGEPMWHVSGVTGAAPVWTEIMDYLNRDGGSRPPEMPSGVIARGIEFQDGIEPPRAELFLEGTDPVFPSLRIASERPGILYPAEGTVISVDPDIPAENQRVFFEASGSSRVYRWRLNDEVVGRAEESVAWRPRVGRYMLALVDNKDRVVASVRFEVRGMERIQ